MSDGTTSSREAPRNLELEVAAELEQVSGVLAAAVWIGEPPRVREVYIAAAPGASVPDLRSATREVLHGNGLVCSADAIQIGVLDGPVEPPPADRPASQQDQPRPPAQPPLATEESEPGTPPPWHGRFLVLSGLDVRRADNQVSCRVQILRIGELLSGEAREIDTPAGRARAAARATLHAVASATRGTALSLEGALVLQLFGRQYVAVSVEAATTRRTTLLSGLLPTERSIEDAACLATLSAIERWLAW